MTASWKRAFPSGQTLGRAVGRSAVALKDLFKSPAAPSPGPGPQPPVTQDTTGLRARAASFTSSGSAKNAAIWANTASTTSLETPWLLR